MIADITPHVPTAWDIREASKMMELIAEWDMFTAERKEAEWMAGGSKYREVPGFEPVFCRECQHDVFADFRFFPEGECPVSPDHEISLSGMGVGVAA